MNKTFLSFLRRGIVMMMLCATWLPVMAQTDAEDQKTIDEAKAIIDRLTGGQLPLRLELSREKTEDGCDSYSTAM